MKDLLQAACKARQAAYAPYSGFAVGAAVRAGSGRIYSGCNIENASYGLTICAERVAVFQAIAAGERSLEELAVVADTALPVAPCGACRQVMAEFGIKNVCLAAVNGASQVMKLEALLPHAFSSNAMGVE
ncbi:MAG: cytidine deaminase [Sporomusaceae bacterium]|nr:cytidine deaminase [Sporomusaceae bacterium]